MGAEYTNAELYAMQKEAERRVFEMQKRANRTLGIPDSEPEEIKPVIELNEPEPEPEIIKEDINKDHSRKPHGNMGTGNFLETMSKDSSRSILLILLIILMNENANQELIFMILYLLI